MTLEQAIEKRKIIDIDFAPMYDLIYTGVCLKANRSVCILVNYDFKKGEFDGYSVFHGGDFSTYAVWKRAGLKIRNNNLAKFIDGFPLDGVNTFYSCLKKITDDELIAFFLDKDIKNFYVDRKLTVSKEKVSIKKINIKGRWSRTMNFNPKRIIYFSFGTNYEGRLVKKLIRENK